MKYRGKLGAFWGGVWGLLFGAGYLQFPVWDRRSGSWANSQLGIVGALESAVVVAV